jgi:hypothetical protein
MKIKKRKTLRAMMKTKLHIVSCKPVKIDKTVTSHDICMKTMTISVVCFQFERLFSMIQALNRFCVLLIKVFVVKLSLICFCCNYCKVIGKFQKYSV